MPAMRTIGHESCRTYAGTPTAQGAMRRCHAFGNTPALQVGYRKRNWESDAGLLEARAAALDLDVADLLCVGCNRRRVRLIAEGAWPA